VAREVQLICEYRSRFLILEETSLWAKCRLSLQLRNRKGMPKKADAQGIDQFFCLANAAKVGSEPSLPIFRDASKACFKDVAPAMRQGP
jgi:hypothetical protein